MKKVSSVSRRGKAGERGGPNAAKVMKPRSELNPGGLAGQFALLGIDQNAPEMFRSRRFLGGRGAHEGLQWNAENPTRRVCRWTIEERCHTEPMVAQLSRQTEDAGAFSLPRSGLVRVRIRGHFGLFLRAPMVGLG